MRPTNEMLEAFRGWDKDVILKKEDFNAMAQELLELRAKVEKQEKDASIRISPGPFRICDDPSAAGPWLSYPGNMPKKTGWYLVMQEHEEIGQRFNWVREWDCDQEDWINAKRPTYGPVIRFAEINN